MMRLVDKELEIAVEVEMGTYQYDNLKLHTRLLARLKDRSAFSLNVLIDEEQFGGRVPKLQRTRLAELKAAGKGRCKVYLCKGKRGKGSYHCKALVIDRRYLYTGGMNFTSKSEDNEELVYRHTGPLVLQVAERMAFHRVKGKLWDGK